VNWLRDEKRSEGPSGAITFGVIVRMTGGRKQHMVRSPESVWKPDRSDGETVQDTVGVQRTGDNSGGGGTDRGAGHCEGRRVGDIEGLGAELKPFRFGDHKVLLQDWVQSQSAVARDFAVAQLFPVECGGPLPGHTLA
jgi:hypothetical protein